MQKSGDGYKDVPLDQEFLLNLVYVYCVTLLYESQDEPDFCAIEDSQVSRPVGQRVVGCPMYCVIVESFIDKGLFHP